MEESLDTSDRKQSSENWIRDRLVKEGVLKEPITPLKDALEELEKKPREEWTGEERQLYNLKAGWTREKRKRPVTNWSAHFRRLLGDRDFLQTIVKSLPPEWQGVVEENPADFIAAGIISITARDIAKSVSDGSPISKSTQNNLTWLSKTGFGDRVVFESNEGDSPFNRPVLQFNVVPDRTDIKHPDGSETKIVAPKEPIQQPDNE